MEVPQQFTAFLYIKKKSKKYGLTIKYVKNICSSSGLHAWEHSLNACLVLGKHTRYVIRLDSE